jgi:myotubularin-related protein 1/2
VDNKAFEICPSYDQQFITFDRLSSQFLTKVAVFRSKGRIPILSAYYRNSGHKLGFVTLWRCSQPSVGFFKNRCKKDEYLLRLIGNPILQMSYEEYHRSEKSSDTPVDLHIFDMRGKKAAIGNKFKGKGYENTDFYQNVNLYFCDIPNIHVVRDSFKDLVKLVSMY